MPSLWKLLLKRASFNEETESQRAGRPLRGHAHGEEAPRRLAPRLPAAPLPGPLVRITPVPASPAHVGPTRPVGLQRAAEPPCPPARQRGRRPRTQGDPEFDAVVQSEALAGPNPKEGAGWGQGTVWLNSNSLQARTPPAARPQLYFTPNSVLSENTHNECFHMRFLNCYSNYYSKFK